MKYILKNILLLSAFLSIFSCTKVVSQKNSISVGAEQFDEFLPFLHGKRIAMIVNHTSVVNKTHLVDSLLKRNVKIVKIFAPEHGFRGTAADGEKIADGKDTKTGLPIISLYGKNRKPTPEQLAEVDVVIYDIQDVGARYYTYIGTMHYAMEACAENNKEMLIFDRPNPNGHYIDGPILDMKYQSFVGMHPVPIVHGMTVGEYAQMINGEKWLEKGVNCNIKVIKCENYTHQTAYQPPIKPSPNLPNYQAVMLYPSICLFEGTEVSLGRGTDMQFQIIGSPTTKNYGNFTFTPQPNPSSIEPPQKGKLCYGQDLRNIKINPNQIDLKYILDFYKKCENKAEFFLKTRHFDGLAGNEDLKKMIIAGKTEAEIRATWQADLAKYKEMRKKYLIYD